MVTLLCDEHVPEQILEQLQEQGVAAFSLTEHGLRGVTDETILDTATENGWVVVTNDDDFLGYVADRDHAGILFIKSQYEDLTDVVREIIR